MTKASQMKQQLVKLGGMVAAVLVVSGGAMFFTGSMASSSAKHKTETENARNNDNSQITSMKTQIEQSGTATKRFVEIELEHPNKDYSADSEALKEWLRLAKDQYRFANNFKLTLALEKLSDKPEFTGMNYDIKVREPVKLEFGAMSDAHVYAFIDDLLHNTPGFVRLTKFELKRRNDMDPSAFRQFLSGLNPDYVSATMEFTWVGVESKPAAAAAPGATATPPEPGA